jgi:hypothetical protein
VALQQLPHQAQQIIRQLEILGLPRGSFIEPLPEIPSGEVRLT